MSTKIRVKKICIYCEKSFVALTTTTKYCSKVCNSRHYKALQRNKKIKISNLEIKEREIQELELLNTKEFLSVTETSKLIGCSRQNIYKLIKSGKLTASNILINKTIIKRSDIEYLLMSNESKTITELKKIDPIIIDLSKCYKLQEVKDKYGVSEKGLSEIIKRNHIPKVKSGIYVFVPSDLIDELLK